MCHDTRRRSGPSRRELSPLPPNSRLASPLGRSRSTEPHRHQERVVHGLIFAHVTLMTTARPAPPNVAWAFILGWTTMCVGASCDRQASEANVSSMPPPPRLDGAQMPPVLIPCPKGWEERFDEELGLSICEPWPASSPVEWVCPDGWRGVEGDGVRTCEPAGTPVAWVCPEGWRGVEEDGVRTCETDGVPVEWVCPAGWRKIVAGGVQTCDPYPEGGPLECGAYQAHFPGDAGCRVVGSACPAGEFAEGLPEGAVYVRPGSTGNGSFEAPFGSIDQVPFEELAPGTVVALAKGRYVGAVEPVGDVILWGACPEETVLTASDDVFRQGTLQLSTPGTSLTVKNLRVSGGTRLGVYIDSPSSLQIEGAIIEQTRRAAIVVENEGRLRLEWSVIRDTQGEPSDLSFGNGLSVTESGQATVDHVLFERNRTVAVQAVGAGTRLNMVDSVVRDTRSQAANLGRGDGIFVVNGAHADVRRVLFERNRFSTALVTGEGAYLILEDAVIRDTQSQESDQAFGRGLSVERGARVEVRRAMFERNRDLGVSVIGGARLSGSDVVIRDTQSRSLTQNFGDGLLVQDGGQADLQRAVVEGNRSTGVSVQGENSSLVLEDAMIRDTKSRADNETRGVGLHVSSGARAEVRRAILERNRAVGVAARGENTELFLEDAVVRDTRSRRSDQLLGYGLSINEKAGAQVRRAVFERNRDFGILVETGADLLMEDIVARDTESRAVDQASGRGLGVLTGARVEVRRGVFDRNRTNGVLVAEASDLVVEDALVRNTRGQASDQLDGSGLMVFSGSSLGGRRVVLEGNRSFGVYVEGEGSRLSLEDAVVRDTRSQESDQTVGRGLAIGSGVEVSVRRALFEGNRDLAVLASGPDAELLLEDAVLRDTKSIDADKRRGRGLAVELGARATVRRAVFARNREYGVSINGDGSKLTLENAIVRDTEGRALDQEGGIGLSVRFGARAEVRRVLFERNRTIGVLVNHADANLVMTDAVIRDTQSRARDRLLGRGLSVQYGGRADVRRALLKRSQEVGAVVFDSTATLSDTVVDTVFFPPCVNDPLPCIQTAHGIVSSGATSTVVLERVGVYRTKQCGIALISEGRLDGSNVLIAENAAGACFYDPLADPASIGATYLNNVERIVFEDLPDGPQPFQPGAPSGD